MKLSELFPHSDRSGSDPEITHITHDSRAVVPGSVFVAISGYAHDGRDFVPMAEENGAAAIVARAPVPTDLPLVLVDDPRQALSRAAAKLYGHPAEKLTMIGITGTKGKTTVSHLLYDTAAAAGKVPGLIGTNGVRYQNVQYDISHTTPESADLQRILRDMVEAGVDTVFMEVSSGGLKLARVADIVFDIGIFTNLAPDHVGPGEHADEEEYAYWKSTLFTQSRKGLLFSDDPRSSFMAEGREPIYYYGSRGDFVAEDIVYGQTLGEKTRFQYKGQDSFPVVLAAPGTFSVYNAVAVLAVSELLGYPNHAPLSVLAQAHVAGRTELLPAPEGIQIVLDYAHNGLSLSSVLKTLRMYNPRRLLVLVGTVGGRTKNRRKELGDAAAQWADIVMLTADNPDFEDPVEIIRDMAASFKDPSVVVYREPDRARAVEKMLDLLQPGDIFLLAGKGHEAFQLIQGKQVPYSDKETVAAYYRKRN